MVIASVDCLVCCRFGLRSKVCVYYCLLHSMLILGPGVFGLYFVCSGILFSVVVV